MEKKVDKDIKDKQGRGLFRPVLLLFAMIGLMLVAAADPAMASAVSSPNGGELDATEMMFPDGSFFSVMRDWTEGLPETLQWLGAIAVSAVPFVESYGGAMIGVFAGMPLWMAVTAAVIGNMLSLALVVYGAHWIRGHILKRKNPKEISDSQQKRREKARKLFDKFGVPGVSILGPLALPSQFTAPLMVSFGANRHAVMLWMFVSVVLWGVGFGLLGAWFLSIAAV